MGVFPSWYGNLKLMPSVSDDKLCLVVSVQEAITDGLEIAVSPRSLHSELMCPICLDMLKNTMTTKECLHRFCADCIITALRSGYVLLICTDTIGMPHSCAHSPMLNMKHVGPYQPPYIIETYILLSFT